MGAEAHHTQGEEDERPWFVQPQEQKVEGVGEIYYCLMGGYKES